MLTSITPLGERSRGSRWGVTVTFLILGALISGAATGLLAGAVGELALGDVSGRTRLAALVLLVAAGLAFELRLGGLRLPTVRRQVNENWLGAYRGWVYGLGFGLQLGCGVATIVTTAAVYLALFAAVLSVSAAGGLAIGATFGLLRGLAVMPAHGAGTPEGLGEVARRLGRLEAPVADLTRGGIAAALIAGAALLAGGWGG
jgi:hypothetical protein